MKKLIRITSMVLCFAIIFCSFPVYASNEKFISVKTVAGSDDEKYITDEILFTDGKYLYVNIYFLTKYMPYTFDEDSCSFVRLNHEINSKYGDVFIDISKKQATLYMNPYSSSEYKLHNIYTFEDQIFLPLDQMAALLKAQVIEETDENECKLLVIGNCLNSICDADYALSKIMTKKYVYYDYEPIVDDIFAGSVLAFEVSADLSYFASTIFGKRLKNLDVLHHSGDYEIYEKFISNCVTDNSVYVAKVADAKSLLYRFNIAMDFTSSTNEFASALTEFSSYMKEYIKPYKERSIEDAAFFIDVRDWNTVLSLISDVTECTTWVLKFASMSQGNKDMINNYVEYKNKIIAPYFNDYNDDFMALAASEISAQFGQDFVSDIVTSLCKEFSKELFKKMQTEQIKSIIKSEAEQAAFGTNAIIFNLALTVINGVCKDCGFDLTDNTNYTILKDLEFKQELGKYFDSFGDKHFESEDETEQYRLSAILWLLACKQIFIDANKLNNKTNKISNYYDNRIDVITDVLGLFYLASQGKIFDSYASTDNVIADNQKTIENMGIIGNSEIKYEEAIKALNENQIVANDDDIKKLDDFIISLSSLPIFDYRNGDVVPLDVEDYSACDPGELLEELSFNSFDLGLYRNYFDEPDEPTEPDPLGYRDHYRDYYTFADMYNKYPADNVDWILKSIFNLKSIDRDSVNTIEKARNDRYYGIYYYDGYYYFIGEVGGMFGSYGVDSYKKINNNTYSVNINFSDETGTYKTTAYIVAQLKNIEGKRLWTLKSSIGGKMIF